MSRTLALIVAVACAATSASAVVGTHDVLRLDVAMEQTGGMHGRNGLTEIESNADGFRQAELMKAHRLSPLMRGRIEYLAYEIGAWSYANSRWSWPLIGLAP